MERAVTKPRTQLSNSRASSVWRRRDAASSDVVNLPAQMLKTPASTRNFEEWRRVSSRPPVPSLVARTEAAVARTGRVGRNEFPLIASTRERELAHAPG